MSVNVPEPVRKYIYGVAIAILGALVAWGVIDQNSQFVIIGIAQAVLLVGAGETVRAKVTPIRPRGSLPDRDLNQAA